MYLAPKTKSNQKVILGQRLGSKDKVYFKSQILRYNQVYGEGRLLPCSTSRLFVGKAIIMKHFPSLLHSTMPEEVAVTRPKRFFTKNTGLRKVLRPCMGADACLDLFSKFFIDLQSKIRNCNKSIYDRIHRPLNEYCEDGIPTNTSLPTQW